MQGRASHCRAVPPIEHNIALDTRVKKGRAGCRTIIPNVQVNAIDAMIVRREDPKSKG